MSDRNNPIKFGPEWLRNLSVERSTVGSTSNTQNTVTSRVATNQNNVGPSSENNSGSGSSRAESTANSGSTAKILMANSRYGKEEMLALCDVDHVDSPVELRSNDILYKSRPKQPFALNSGYEEDARENTRIGVSPLSARSPSGHNIVIGRGRGTCLSDSRGRPRMPFTRTSGLGRGSWHTVSPRVPGITTGANDEASSQTRTWNNSNGGPSGSRTVTDQPDWSSTKLFRSSRRPGSTSNNWRQSTTREDEVWRPSDQTKSRPMHPEQRERDWIDRPNPSKWNPIRRSLTKETNSDENLPEWAVGGADVSAGSFDASGAFHGCNYDDTNISPKENEPPSILQSQTFNNLSRTKNLEDSSEEWWASEKANKLLPKKFEVGDIKTTKNRFPLLTSESSEDTTDKKLDSAQSLEKKNIPSTSGENEKNKTTSDKIVKRKIIKEQTKQNTNQKTVENNDDHGNFQSVMLTPNNCLRQKHQNMVQPAGNKNENIQNNQQQSVQGLDMGTKTMPQESDRNVDGEITEVTKKAPEIISTKVSTTVPCKDSSIIAAVVNNLGQGLSDTMSPRISTAPGFFHPDLTSLIIPTGSQVTQNTAQNTPIMPLGMPGNTMVGIDMTQKHPGSNLVLPNPLLGPTVQVQGGSLPVQSGRISGYPSGFEIFNSNDQANRTSLFMGQNASNTFNPPPAVSMPNQASHMFPIQGLSHSSSQIPFESSLYSSNPMYDEMVDWWYYEDPKKVVQGPFTSQDMYNWYTAGFFKSTLMIRRAVDKQMRSLGSYGPVVPFAPTFPDKSSEIRNSHSLLDQELPNQMDQFRRLGGTPQGQQNVFGQHQNMVESLWDQPVTTPDVLWQQQAISARNNALAHNLSMFIWEQKQQSSAVGSNALLPEKIMKEMKTEDQILAQLRSSQNLNDLSHNSQTVNEEVPASVAVSIAKRDSKPVLPVDRNISEKILPTSSAFSEIPSTSGSNIQLSTQEENTIKLEKPIPENDNIKIESSNKNLQDIKSNKQTKLEFEKSVKSKDSSSVKVKKQKPKEEKKDEIVEIKNKEDVSNKVEKRSRESSPTKLKKDEKVNKKELEKQKNEWIKEGFTIVKGPEKSSNKENKKKMEDAKASEDIEKKRREQEKLLAEQERKKKEVEATKKQQEEQYQRQALESLTKKAPWSSSPASQQADREGPTFAEIQRLEREKKLEQIKEQQQMMQIIAEQQAAALAREQEIQASLGWARKKMSSTNIAGPSFVEIQAETRRASTSAAISYPVHQESISPNNNPSLWTTADNGGGFWDTPSISKKVHEKAPNSSKPVETLKSKKKSSSVQDPTRNKLSPAVEFETWCSSVLINWSTKIDVPTFVNFLKEVESPYEVKDYVKCYLGESNETNDFARQFLEKRSKLHRASAASAPSDDLCSPALAINPRNNMAVEQQEVKTKGKKIKKNKMMKVDSRILGFSVTASEDRINVGDIDTV